MDSKQIRIYEILRAAIDQYVELEGTLQGKRVVFCSVASRTSYGKQFFVAEFKKTDGQDEEPEAIYFSNTNRLVNNDSSKAVIMDNIDSIQVVF